jgi:pimeloyl-ACP methyl ester carboxylesterase
MTRAITLRNGVSLEYLEHGDPGGHPVVLLHGVTDSCHSFQEVLSHLPPSLRALAISLRGHGGSSRPAHGYRFVDFAADVDAFLDALEIPAAVIVGHSLGSYVAQRFAMQRADRTLGLVLMGSFPTLRGNAGVTDLWDSVISTLTDPVDPTFVREFQLSTLARPVPAEVLDRAVSESLKVPARVWRAAFADFLEADFSRDLPRITAPTIIAWGERDAYFLRADQMTLHAAIPGSRLVIYPGGGHAFHWEDPATFAADLVTFVRQSLFEQPASAAHRSDILSQEGR